MASFDQLPSSFANSIILPIKIFQFIGLDFFDPKISSKNRWRLILFLTMFFTFLFGHIFYIAMVDDFSAEFLEIANAIPCLMLLLQSVSKLTLIRKKHLVKQIILDIAELWPNDSEIEEKKELMNEWLRRLKTFCETVFKLTVIGIVTFMWPQIFIYFFISSRSNDDAAYLYPFQLQYPKIKVDSMWKYLVAYLMQAVAGAAIHTGIYHSSDLLLITLSVDVSVLVRVLAYDLANIQVERGREEESLATLKQIVKTHQKLLRLAQDLNQIFGAILFTVLIFSSVIICFFGFLTIANDGGQYIKIINLATVLQILFLVFYITLPGQILSDISSGISDAAYQSMWYNSDMRFRKMIFIIIARSQKPCRLHALGYIDLNFAMYCKICSTAWSYLSLVNQMYNTFESNVKSSSNI